MPDYSSNKDAFDKICGNCTGLMMNEITEDDVRTQAHIYSVNDEWLRAAIRGLKEYQEEV